MDTLVQAVLIIGGVIFGLVVLGAVSNGLSQKTGKGLGEWIGDLVMTFVCFVFGAVGVSIVQWGMEIDNVVAVVAGIIVVAVAALVALGTWTGGRGSGYNPMSGKRAHYDRQGKLTGYSDKE